MSDRAYFQLYVYDCPPEQVAAVLKVIEDFDLADEHEPGLHLAEDYSVEEASLDIVDDIAADLMKAAPGASWQCWQDPKYEHSGVIAMYAPGLGLFTGQCDSNGTPLFNGEEIKGWIEHEAPTMTLDDFLNEVWTRRTGYAWQKRHTEQQERNGKAVLPDGVPADGELTSAEVLAFDRKVQEEGR